MKNMKNLFLAGLIALAAVITLAGCPTDADTDDGGPSLPASKGVNALGGKTYFEYQSKTVFSATAEDASSGTYTVSEAKYSDNDYVLDNGKYTYVETETGVYSWDADAKTVTLVPEKIAQWEEDGYGALQTRAEYRKTQQTALDGYKKEMGEEAFNKELAKMGFSSVSAYLDYTVDETFAQKKNAYSFSDDGKALFLEEVLPANKGTNELAGQTYNGMNNDNPRGKDTNKVYTFKADGTYSFVDNTSRGYKQHPKEGNYAVDSSNAQRKWVYLQPAKVDEKTRTAYYKDATAYPGHNYADDDAYRAAQTNGAFSLSENPYNSDKKTIGWD
jgi:hypothetical protein